MDRSILDVKNKCCGCGLCIKECPFNAISMQENEEGFLYPVINENLCKNCGKCSLVCIAKKEYKKEENKNQKAYMVINKNLKEYKNSASGGFATVLSRYVINELSGIVYGATMDKEYNVKHILVDNVENLYLLQGSKYVQSNLEEVFSTIKESLKRKIVLFIGTPCQVDSMKRYTNNNENLITCDLVCHGVPSPGVFKKYLNYLSKKYKDKIVDFRFRNKCNFDKCGYVEKIFFESGKTKKIIAEYDPFYNDFIRESNYRYSCYSCQYKNRYRVGDFTIGDVNSWENYYDFFPEMSTSLVITNNKKAEEIIENLKPCIYSKNISVSEEVKLNSALNKQIKLKETRENIYKKYENFNNYEKETLRNISKKEKIKIIVKRVIPFFVRIKLKKIKKREKHE